MNAKGAAFATSLLKNTAEKIGEYAIKPKNKPLAKTQARLNDFCMLMTLNLLVYPKNKHAIAVAKTKYKLDGIV